MWVPVACRCARILPSFACAARRRAERGPGARARRATAQTRARALRRRARRRPSSRARREELVRVAVRRGRRDGEGIVVAAEAVEQVARGRGVGRDAGRAARAAATRRQPRRRSQRRPWPRAPRPRAPPRASRRRRRRRPRRGGPRSRRWSAARATGRGRGRSRASPKPGPQRSPHLPGTRAHDAPRLALARHRRCVALARRHARAEERRRGRIAPRRRPRRLLREPLKPSGAVPPGSPTGRRGAAMPPCVPRPARPSARTATPRRGSAAGRAGTERGHRSRAIPHALTAWKRAQSKRCLMSSLMTVPMPVFSPPFPPPPHAGAARSPSASSLTSPVPAEGPGLLR